MQSHAALGTVLGDVTIFENDGYIVALEWGRAPPSPETPLLIEAKQQLVAYFDRTLKVFDLPLKPEGSDYQKRAWQAMTHIPFGETRTYGALAKDLKSSARAIGSACRTNPIPIIIPCHRVLSANGGLGGYSGGHGPETKALLLRIEGLVLT